MNDKDIELKKINIGKILRDYREQNNLTKQEFANRVGVSFSTYHGLERRSDIKFNMLLQFCVRLGLNINYFLKDTEYINLLKIHETNVEISKLIKERNKLKKRLSNIADEIKHLSQN